jgi:3-methyladenine DNA glycosylase Tag
VLLVLGTVGCAVLLYMGAGLAMTTIPISSSSSAAFMQAVGMVNDHTVDCFRYSELNR